MKRLRDLRRQPPTLLNPRRQRAFRKRTAGGIKIGPIRAPKNCESEEKSRFMARKRARLFVSFSAIRVIKGNKRTTKIQRLQLVWLHENALCRFATWWTRGYATGFFLSARPSRSSASSSSYSPDALWLTSCSRSTHSGETMS